MLPFSRRRFMRWLATLPLARESTFGLSQQPVVDVRPTALFQQPEGRKNLVRITVTGVAAPAARASVTDRHGALVGTAGLLPAAEGPALTGEVWVPLSEPSDFQFDVEVGRNRVARRRLRLTPAKRWTLYLLSSIHTDVGYTDLQERALEVHRKNLDEALAWLTTHRDFHFSAECALQVLSYVEDRSPEAADALVQAIQGGRIGWGALFANMLTGLLDHESFARLCWPAGRLARERGLAYLTAQITDVPGQALTFPMMLAASGVKYLASGPNPERAAPLLPASGGTGRQPRAALARAPLRRRHALRVRRRRRRDGTPPVRLAAESTRVSRPKLAVRLGIAVRGGLAGQRHNEGSDRRERAGIRATLYMAAHRDGPRRGFLPRCGAPLRLAHSGAARRHGIVLGRRRGLDRRRACQVSLGTARRAGRGDSESLERPAPGGRRYDGIPCRPVARSLVVRRAHVGRRCKRFGAQLAADNRAVGVQEAVYRCGKRRCA